MTMQAGELTADSFRSGKGGGDENFPVASFLISAPLRPVIMAFYDFVRAGDDVADHPDLTPEQKLFYLDRLEASLMGQSDAEPLGVRLKKILDEWGLQPWHTRDLLDAFRRDATKKRYESWDELIDYCRLSAMPVGRFLLDVHGESRELWPASDAICAALQINNHLQDCQKDFLALDRVYIPLDALQAEGASIEDLRADRASPPLRACLKKLAERNSALLEQGAPLVKNIKDFRLGLEIAVVLGLARRISGLLVAHDPLSEKVRLDKQEMARGALADATREAGARLLRKVVR